MLLADDLSNHSGALCTILLIATVVLLIVGLLEACNVVRVTGNRFGALVAGVVLLVVYIVVC